MAKKTGRKFSAEFKAKVVLEKLRERSTIEELSVLLLFTTYFRIGE